MSLGETPQRRKAIKEDAPQSTRNVLAVALMQMQVCKRPPLPKASPLPKNRTWIVSNVDPPEEGDKSHDTIDDQLYTQFITWYSSIRAENG